jgi:hypothetical protein
VDRQLDIDARHLLDGPARLRRVAPWGFPAAALTGNGETIALIGRMGWFRIYFGRGQRIELADGTRWTLTSVTTGGTISPVILDASGRRVTQAGFRHGTYGINGRDYAAVLHPADTTGLGRANRWMISDDDGEVAIIVRSPLSVIPRRPVHVGAVLIAFALVRFGLPEESAPLMPAFRWGAR